MSVCHLSRLCSGATSSQYTAVGQRLVRGREAQRGGSQGPPGERGPAGGGGSAEDHQRGSRHPPPGEVHAGSGSSHHRWGCRAFSSFLADTDLFLWDGLFAKLQPLWRIHPVWDAAAGLPDMWLSLDIQPSTLTPFDYFYLHLRRAPWLPYFHAICVSHDAQLQSDFYVLLVSLEAAFRTKQRADEAENHNIPSNKLILLRL